MKQTEPQHKTNPRRRLLKSRFLCLILNKRIRHSILFHLQPTQPYPTSLPAIRVADPFQQKPLFNKSWYETVFTLICDVLVKFHLKCEKQSLESLKVIHFWLVPMCHKIFRFFFFNFTINKKKIMTAFYCFYSFHILLVYVNKLHMYMCWKLPEKHKQLA